MNSNARRLAAGFGLSLLANSAIAAQGGISPGNVLLSLLAVCWIGLPVLLLLALGWQVVRSFIASLKRPAPVIRAPDTDLMV